MTPIEIRHMVYVEIQNRKAEFGKLSKAYAATEYTDPNLLTLCGAAYDAYVDARNDGALILGSLRAQSPAVVTETEELSWPL